MTDDMRDMQERLAEREELERLRAENAQLKADLAQAHKALGWQAYNRGYDIGTLRPEIRRAYNELHRNMTPEELWASPGRWNMYQQASWQVA